MKHEFQEKSSEFLSLLNQIFYTTEGRKRWIESWFRENDLSRVAQYFSNIEDIDNELDDLIENEESDEQTAAHIHTLEEHRGKLDAKRLLLLDNFEKKTYLDDASEFLIFTEKNRKRPRAK